MHTLSSDLPPDDPLFKKKNSSGGLVVVVWVTQGGILAQISSNYLNKLD